MNFKSLCLSAGSSVSPTSIERDLNMTGKSKKKSKRNFLVYIRQKIDQVFLNIDKNDLPNMKANQCKSFSNSFLDGSEDSFPEIGNKKISIQQFDDFHHSPINKKSQDNCSSSLMKSLKIDDIVKQGRTCDDRDYGLKQNFKKIKKVDDAHVEIATGTMEVRSNSRPETIISSPIPHNVIKSCEASISSRHSSVFNTNCNGTGTGTTNKNDEKSDGMKIACFGVISEAHPSQPNNNHANLHIAPNNVQVDLIVEGEEKSLAHELRVIAKYGWYWGPINRTEAEEKLNDQPDGAFLLRDSSDTRHLISLSFKSFGKTLHTRIEHSNGWYSFYPQPDRDGHRSLVDLIDHCIMESDTGVFCYSRPLLKGSPRFPVRLTKPVSRFTQVRSLQYLCRFVIRQYTSINHIQTLPVPSKIKGYLQLSYF